MIFYLVRSCKMNHVKDDDKSKEYQDKQTALEHYPFLIKAGGDDAGTRKMILDHVASSVFPSRKTNMRSDESQNHLPISQLKGLIDGSK